MKLAAIKDVIRSNGYAWPGGYPIYFVTSDCDALSVAGARAHWREIVAAHLANDTHSDWNIRRWYIVGADINWENEMLYCAYTGARIESAYGES
jgi:hypothetical protein